jgi:hypothetical protein
MVKGRQVSVYCLFATGRVRVKDGGGLCLELDGCDCNVLMVLVLSAQLSRCRRRGQEIRWCSHPSREKNCEYSSVLPSVLYCTPWPVVVTSTEQWSNAHVY